MSAASEAHKRAKAACVKAMLLLGVAAREHDATAPALAFQYRFTAAMLAKHTETWTNPAPATPDPDVAFRLTVEGRA